MAIKQVYLGWGKPALVSAADYLCKRYARDGELDLSNVLVGDSSSREAFREIEAASRSVDGALADVGAVTDQTSAATMQVSTASTASLPDCDPSTQASHTTVASSGKAMSCLKVSIHGPGLGSFLSAVGKNESSSTGRRPIRSDNRPHNGANRNCIAENEAESPWPPFHVDAGFAASDSTVTVIGASPGHNLFTYGCETGQEILDHFIGGMTALGHNNVIFPTGPLLVIGPEHAGVLARDGIDKAAIRKAVYERARIPLARFAPRTVKGLHHRRSRWFELHLNADHIGVADQESLVNIVVAGGAGIHSMFVPTSFSYHPVTKRIKFR